jgi:preprotein translocase SecE subunit
VAETKVTRIKATDTPAKTSKARAPKKQKPVRNERKAPKAPKAPKNPFLKALYGIGGYFKGAWFELRQVRWPSRKATWGLTLAVILFSLFFVVIIALLDLLFKSLFELIIT